MNALEKYFLENNIITNKQAEISIKTITENIYGNRIFRE